MWDNVYELKLLKMPLISLCHSALCATSCHKKEITMYKWPTVVSDDSHLWNITGFHFVVIFLPFILHARNIYIFICDATESQELNRITKLLQWEGRISSPMPCSKQGQHCIRSPEAFTSEGWRSLIPSPSPHTRCSSLMIVLVASTGLQFIIVFPCIDAVLQTWSNECWVKGHNHFAPSTASVPVIQPNMLQLASDRGIWIILHPMLIFVWVILMGDGILCVYFHEYHYLLFVPCGRKILKY